MARLGAGRRRARGGAGLRRRRARGPPAGDLTVFALGLVELLLIAQVVVSIVAPFTGNHATGDLLEYWVYLVTALLIPPAATLWALVAKSRWSTAILAAAAFAIAIMVWRMSQIWFVQLV